ncbi:hypothetical protein TWF730_002847 [Orbilia blumenaviensis]|uniref:Uncharacterized protein n=1 Tax=Orbilia blumenaviensis TaxID=1796055 RepID=A0AAV9U7I6_9PEZI
MLMTLLVSATVQSTFLTIISTPSTENRSRNDKVKVSVTEISTIARRVVQKRQTSPELDLQSTPLSEAASSSLTTSLSTTSTSPGFTENSKPSSIGPSIATLSSFPPPTPSQFGTGTGTLPPSTGTGGPSASNHPPTPSDSQPSDKLPPTGFPSWAYAVLIPVLLAMSGAVLAANCVKRRRRKEQEPVPSPPLPIASPPENHTEKFLGNIRALTSTNPPQQP